MTPQIKQFFRAGIMTPQQQNTTTIDSLNNLIQANPEAPADWIRQAAREMGRRGGLAGRGVPHNVDHDTAVRNGRAAALIRWGKRDKSGNIPCEGITLDG